MSKQVELNWVKDLAALPKPKGPKSKAFDVEKYASELAEEVIELKARLKSLEEKSRKFDRFRTIVKEQASAHNRSDALESEMLRLLGLAKKSGAKDDD